jgi:hypothetical protein
MPAESSAESPLRFGQSVKPSAARRTRISAEFNGIAWTRWGSAPYSQRIAYGFGAAVIKAGFYRFTGTGRPAAPSRFWHALKAALARRSVPPPSSFIRRFGAPFWSSVLELWSFRDPSVPSTTFLEGWLVGAGKMASKGLRTGLPRAARDVCE